LRLFTLPFQYAEIGDFHNDRVDMKTKWNSKLRRFNAMVKDGLPKKKKY